MIHFGVSSVISDVGDQAENLRIYLRWAPNSGQGSESHSALLHSSWRWQQFITKKLISLYKEEGPHRPHSSIPTLLCSVPFKLQDDERGSVLPLFYLFQADHGCSPGTPGTPCGQVHRLPESPLWLQLQLFLPIIFTWALVSHMSVPEPVYSWSNFVLSLWRYYTEENDCNLFSQSQLDWSPQQGSALDRIATTCQAF